MQRTISAMVGKGSVNHNSRKFKAENVDADRSHLNIDSVSYTHLTLPTILRV